MTSAHVYTRKEAHNMIDEKKQFMQYIQESLPSSSSSRIWAEYGDGKMQAIIQNVNRRWPGHL